MEQILVKNSTLSDGQTNLWHRDETGSSGYEFKSLEAYLVITE